MRRREKKKALTQLIQGTKGNDMEMVHNAIQCGALIQPGKGPTKKHPLHFAAQHNSTEVLQFLLDSKADPDVMDHAKMTPLHFAAMKGKDAAIRLLLRRGADIGARDTAEYTPLLFAALDGHEKSAQILIDAGADLDARDKVGQTGLMFAACKNKVPVLRLLLDRGADRYLHGKGNITALDYALRKKNRTCIDLLEGKQVPVNKPKQSAKLATKKSDAELNKSLGASRKSVAFDHAKAMKAPEEGQAGYRASAAPLEKPQSKLEQLVARHESGDRSDAQGSMTDYADKLQQKGFGCVSAYDKAAAQKAVDELKNNPAMSAEMLAQIKDLGLDKLE